MKLTQLLAEPYPYYHKGRELAYIMIIIFLMSLGFNYLFEPFEVYRPEHKFSFFWICIIHSATAVLAASFCLGLVNLKVHEDTWTVGREILLILIILGLIGISQFLIRDLIYDNPDNWSWRYLLEEIRNTYLVGTLFVIILVPSNFLRLNYNHTHKASGFRPKTNTSADSPVEPIAIRTQLKSDDFVLNPTKLLFARAEGNYLELYLEEDQKPEKLLKRLTLKELEAQLAHFPFLVKTHRSYLVNVKKIQELSGNAQGYKLTLPGYDEPVPVARGMIPHFEKNIRKR